MSIPNFNIVSSFKARTKQYAIGMLVFIIIFCTGTFFFIDRMMGIISFIIFTVCLYAMIIVMEEEVLPDIRVVNDYEWLINDKLYDVIHLNGCPDPAKVFNYAGLLGHFEDDGFQEYLLSNLINGHLSVLPMLYGEMSDNTLLYDNLAEAPSLLIAGISGSGKSTLLHQLLAVLLTYNKPSNLELYLCDTKRVELNRYAKFPHTKQIIYDHDAVDGFLQSILQEINARYEYLESMSITSIAEYNKVNLGENMRMPFIVVVIEELGDIMLGSDKEVQHKLIKILQKGRAAGVHVIALTQRPSASIINSSIKANIPNRVSLRVASATDSRIIIEQTGAELLVNNKGEMLVLHGGKLDYAVSTVVTQEEIKRLQEAWLTNNQLDKRARN